MEFIWEYYHWQTHLKSKLVFAIAIANRGDKGKFT